MQRRGWLFLTGCILFVFAAYSLLSRLPSREEPTGIQTGEESQLELTCKLLKETWHGYPVYALENQSDETLVHVSVLSFSEQHLPIIWLGSKNKPYLPDLQMSVPPPVNLPAKQVLWFAGSQTKIQVSLRHFKIEWLKNGTGQSEIVQPNG
jgi:hypothetical protein